MISKKVDIVILVDWKTLKVRFCRTKKKINDKATEIPIKLALTLNIPNKPTLSGSAEINIKEEKVQDITIDTI